MVASFTTSVLFTKEQIFEAECGSSNFIPSMSSVIGVSPGKYIWRMAIALHCFPRFLIACLYHNQFKTCWQKLSTKSSSLISSIIMTNLIRLNTALEFCEVVCLIFLSYISTKENYPLHEKAFITFLSSSTLRMITCLILFRCLLYKPFHEKEKLLDAATTTARPLSKQEQRVKSNFEVSYKWKYRLFYAAFFFSIILVYFYFKHTFNCANGIGKPTTAWSYFSLMEYIICCTIMGYHATVCLDFNHFELTIYNKTRTTLNFSLLSSENEQSTDEDVDQNLGDSSVQKIIKQKIK